MAGERYLDHRRESGAEEVDGADAGEEAQRPCLVAGSGLQSPPGDDPLEALPIAVAAHHHPGLSAAAATHASTAGCGTEVSEANHCVLEMEARDGGSGGKAEQFVPQLEILI